VSITSARAFSRAQQPLSNLFGTQAAPMLVKASGGTPGAGSAASIGQQVSTPAAAGLPPANFADVVIALVVLGGLGVIAKLVVERAAPEGEFKSVRIGLWNSFAITVTVIFWLTILKMAFGVAPLKYITPARTVILAA
jgi:hypothetical protein